MEEIIILATKEVKEKSINIHFLLSAEKQCGI